LFFGCRNPLQDFLYEDELRGFETAGVTRLFPAFWREPGKPRAYVQDSIKAHATRSGSCSSTVRQCGEASRMAPDVRQAFIGLFQQRTGTVADGQAWLTGLVTSQRYLEDIWASAS
jgi:cytochrome P450/NADPH-cytochrome P450 reductase